ncbi:MAG: class I SAM-dependent methyltransferase [archaeon]
MGNNIEFWEERHRNSGNKFNRVTGFAKFCYYRFMKDKSGKLVDLGCGKGADSIYFNYMGLKVTAIDYSQEAMKMFNEMQQQNNVFIANLTKDITEPLPFEENSQDFVYSRLSLHYFDDVTTKKMFTEINRILKSEGILCFQAKSTSDKKYGQGKEIEKDMFEDEEGYVRHFFSEEYAKELLSEFEIIYIENRVMEDGNAYLDAVAKKR